MSEKAAVPRLVDTHAHFDEFMAEGIAGDILSRCRDVGVQRVVAIGGSPEANERALALAGAYPDMVRATVGMDRSETRRQFDRGALRTRAGHPLVVAIGESGLDYHYARDTRTEQLALFEEMLELAAAVRRPIVVHSREADDDTIHCLRAFVGHSGAPVDHPGVLHCMTGSEAFARRLLNLGFYISFSGIVTFKNSHELRAVARMVPADRFLFETDAPYLAPVPMRGKRNEPAWVSHIAAALAIERNISLQELAEQVWENASRLFAWREKET